MIVSPEDKDKPSCPATAGTGLPLTRARLNAQTVATVGLLRSDDDSAVPDSPSDQAGELPPTAGVGALTPTTEKSTGNSGNSQ